MRDIFLTAVVFGLLPLVFKRPWIGILLWSWLGYMNPHRLAWGFATTLPFAMVIGIATVIGALFSSEPRKLKGGAATVVLLIFVVYITVTTFFALIPDRAWPMLDRAIKVQLGTLLALTLLYRKEHVLALMWVVAGSIGFYAVKGGVFTIVTLGRLRVWGPADSFIADNNAFALAAVMSIPLWVYLYTQYRSRPWIKFGILAAIVLTGLAALGSQSRGAVVAIVAMAAFLWLKSRRKLVVAVVLVVAAIASVAFMPEQWEARISTISNPRADASANARLEVWTMLWNLAVDRPLTGGGFEPYSRQIFQQYNPFYQGSLSAHSIYFQVLGEHGFVALGLFLLFWFLVWRMCTQVAKATRGNQQDHWAYWLAQMVKVSLVAYLVGGAFQNLAYWDLPYYLFVAIAVTRVIVREQARSRATVDVSGDRSIAYIASPAA
jgi:probable O-glycosylation ligase (exosortase A-associated)